MNTDELNSFYKSLDLKRKEVVSLLGFLKGRYKITVGWFNGHYAKDGNGDFQIEYFPIPVISIYGLCDIEISTEGASVSTKLKREDALGFDIGQLKGYAFEVFGVVDYLSTYYAEGVSEDQYRKNILASKEKDIGFAFSLPNDKDGKSLLALLKLLIEDGFFY